MSYNATAFLLIADLFAGMLLCLLGGQRRPTSWQAALREKYRRYVEARLAVYRVLPDIDASTGQAAVATRLQGEIWAGTIAALAESPPTQRSW